VFCRFFNYPHTGPHHHGINGPSLLSTAPNFTPHQSHSLPPLLGLPPPPPPQHCIQAAQHLTSNLITPHHSYQHPTNMGLEMHQPSPNQFSSTSSSIQGVQGNSNGWYLTVEYCNIQIESFMLVKIWTVVFWVDTVSVKPAASIFRAGQ
jgi:hypothetical protein